MNQLKFVKETSSIVATLINLEIEDIIYIICMVCLYLSLNKLGFNDWESLDDNTSIDSVFLKVLNLDKGKNSIAGALGKQAMTMYIWLEKSKYDFTK